VKNGPLLFLSWTSGCLDALSYLGLGRIFTANMTGNTVLFGLALAQGNWLDVLHALVALLGFALGAIGGTFLVERNYERKRAGWTPSVLFALTVEGCLLLIFAIVWPFAKALSQSSPPIYILILVAGLAMGLQSAIVVSLSVPGVSTTYITGTITTLMSAIGRRLFIHTQEPPPLANAQEAQIEHLRPLRLAAVWLIYIVAAGISGFTALHIPALASFLPLLAVVMAIIHAFSNRPARIEE